MKRLLFCLFLCISFQKNIAQNAVLAYQYYQSGAYEKALPIFEKLHQKYHYNETYFSKLLSCYEQLEQFEKAKKIAIEQTKKHPRQPQFWVYLGNVYRLLNNKTKEEECYHRAIQSIQKNPYIARAIGKAFSNKNMLDKALLSYEIAMRKDPKQNYFILIAQIYAEKGEMESMFKAYINSVLKKPQTLNIVKKYMGKFITDDPENPNNKRLLKIVLTQLQKDPKAQWNDLLSWLFIQQQNYDKAFIQQKAIFKRKGYNLKTIGNLGKICLEKKQYATAQKCFNFVLTNTSDVTERIRTELNLIQIAIATQQNTRNIEEKFQQLLQQHGKNKGTINLQIAYADFVTFELKEPERAKDILKDAAQIPASKFIKSTIKNKLADVLVFTNKFNTALIYYTQVQNDLKNHEIAQESRLKIAKTSYFKGDFDWAKAQVKVLKSASSKLIANDALALFLLLTNNKEKDSTHTNLKKYANAQLLKFQRKNKEAISSLGELLTTAKGQLIEDDALYEQAQLFELENQPEKSVENYLKIINLATSTLKDDAIYHLAKVYQNQLNKPLKAKEYYQKIVFDYASSIYLVEARKNYRMLKKEYPESLQK